MLCFVGVQLAWSVIGWACPLDIFQKPMWWGRGGWGVGAIQQLDGQKICCPSLWLVLVYKCGKPCSAIVASLNPTCGNKSRYLLQFYKMASINPSCNFPMWNMSSTWLTSHEASIQPNGIQGGGKWGLNYNFIVCQCRYTTSVFSVLYVQLLTHMCILLFVW